MMITKLKIRYYGDPCLKRISDPVSDFDASHRLLLRSMLKTMYESEGVGLAAPQVGINERFFIADIGDGPVVVINPEVLKKSNDKCDIEEGCLSVPGLNINIKRPKNISVKYIDLENNLIKRDLEDLMARVFLHELDHLDGITIIDHAPEKNREKLEGKVKQFLAKKENSNSN